jgi:hypothetical protein
LILLKLTTHQKKRKVGDDTEDDDTENYFPEEEFHISTLNQTAIESISAASIVTEVAQDDVELSEGILFLDDIGFFSKSTLLDQRLYADRMI